MHQFRPLLLVSALALASALTASPQKPKASESGFKLPMQLLGSMPAIEGRVNGKGPFVFAIDSGAQGMARVRSAQPPAALGPERC